MGLATLTFLDVGPQNRVPFIPVKSYIFNIHLSGWDNDGELCELTCLTNTLALWSVSLPFDNTRTCA